MPDFIKGEIYYHKADGRRLVHIYSLDPENQDGNELHYFRYVDYKGVYCARGFHDYEISGGKVTDDKGWSFS